ncbi:MAG: hypothetical protein COB02_11825 [Candidatus Cloacimonadota bacterium]|nr:MAG: hypothetical protein COB02_11825 [Candidatus Cloacimonadota bacterium]
MKNEIFIYDSIGEGWYDEGITGKTIKRQLDKMQGDITVRINSLGGDVFEAAAIYNLLKEHDGKVTIKIDSIAASAASVIAMAGDEIIIPLNAMIMIHNPWTFAYGESADFLKTAERLDKIRQTIANVYVEKSNASEKEIFEMMDEETWMTSEEAITFGFATKEEAEKPFKVENKSSFNFKNFKNYPKQLVENQKRSDSKVIDDLKNKKEQEQIKNNKKKIQLEEYKLNLMEII